MMEDSDAAERPPRPPDIHRTLKLYPAQWIGLPILLAIPLVALFGVFGGSWDTLRGATPSFEVEIRYPTRFRYKELAQLHVFVTNSSARSLDTVTVAFDTAYVSGFSTVTFLPPAKRPYEVELTDLAPEETRLLEVELQAEGYWRQAGPVTVTAGGRDTVSFRLSTIIFP